MCTPNASCPTTVSSNLSNFGPASVLTRGTQLKIQNLQTVFAQSDYINTFNWAGVRHEVLAGVDYALEKKQVYACSSPPPRAATTRPSRTPWPAPPTTAPGSTNRPALRLASQYRSQGIGLYAQDLVQVAPDWKVLGGLRHELPVWATTTLSASRQRLQPHHDQQLPNAGLRVELAPGRAVPAQSARQLLRLRRHLVQHLRGRLLAQRGQPEHPARAAPTSKSAPADSADKRFTTRLAAFYSTKYQERNTDPWSTWSLCRANAMWLARRSSSPAA